MSRKKKEIDREVWWVVGKSGYIQGRVFRNGVCRAIGQHRWAMEQHTGIALLPSEAVHHINGIRGDNRIENLEVRTRNAHATASNLAREYNKGYKPNLSPKERKRRSEWMKEVHRRRKLNDPTNKWYGKRRGTTIQQGNI